MQVTATQKRGISNTTKRLEMNVSELMRQTAQDFTSTDHENAINALIGQVNASTEEANEALDDALSFVAESNKRIAAMTEEKR